MDRKSVRKELIRFTIPVFISSIFSELYSVTNSALVGNFVSLKALSAVSACTWICNIFNYTFYGLGMGAGIVVANYYGANNKKRIKTSLDTAIVFAVAGGILLTIISELMLPQLMIAINISADLYQDAYNYLRVYMLGTTFVLTAQMCFFIMRSFGETKHQLYYSIISSITNVTLGFILVRYVHLDVVGTAIATITSQCVMDVLALRRVFALDENFKFDFHNIEFEWGIVSKICRLGIPAGIQNMLIALSSMAVQSYVNLFPNEVIAGIGVAEKVIGWCQIISCAVSAGTMAIVSQCTGSKDYKRAQYAIVESMLIGTIGTIIFVNIEMIIAPYIIGCFNQNVDVIKYGSEMIRYSCFAAIILNISHVYNGACRGAGNVRAPMIIAILTQVVCKYLFVFIGLKISFDVHVLYFGTAFGYSLAGIAAGIYFHKSKWTKEHQLRA